MWRSRVLHSVLAIALGAFVMACSGASNPSAPGHGTPTTSAAGSPLATPAVATAAAATPAIVEPGAPWIVYQGGTIPGGPTQLRMVRPDGRDDHLLITVDLPSDDQGHPAWSPDGSRIVFDLFIPNPATPGKDRVEVWVIDADGSKPAKLADCALPCLQLAYPAWSPDGSAIVLAAYDVAEDGTWGPSAIEILEVASGLRRSVARSADGTGLEVGAWSLRTAEGLQRTHAHLRP